MPLRVRDMGEGDCCSGRACQNMPPPLDQDLPKHTERGREGQGRTLSLFLCYLRGAEELWVERRRVM